MKILNVIAFNSYWGTDLPANVLDLEDGKTVGGGEEAGIRCGSGLVALGHEVLTYWYGQHGVWRGMEMRSLDDELYATLVSGKWDAVISWSGLRALEWAPKTSRRIFAQQLNDLFSPGGWDRVDCIVSPSRSHAEQLATWGWNKRPIAVVHNGLDIDQYVDAPAWESRPYDVGYWSSPDRGLHHLLAAWPYVLKREPRARLHVFYEITRYLEGATLFPGLYCERAQILTRELVKAKLDKTVTFHGAVPRRKLAPIQKQCRVMCYPYDPAGYCEGFCHPAGTLITTIEGLKPVERLTLRDLVLGKHGHWRSISALKSRTFGGRTVRVLPACGEAVEMTSDHPVFAAKTGAPTPADFKWVNAGELQAGMWLYSASPRQAETELGMVELPARVIHPSRMENGRQGVSNFGGKPPIVLPEAVPVTPELCRLVGYFAGDGNAPNRGRTASTLSFFLGSEQKWASVEDLRQCIVKVFGTEPTVKDRRPDKKMFAVQLQSHAIAHVFSDWCYAADGKKLLPQWAMSLPIDLTKEVLKGLWRTDGTVVQASGARFAGFTSASPYLIGQVRTLLNRIGLHQRIHDRTHGNGGVSRFMYFSIAGEFLDYPNRTERGPGVKAGSYSRQLSDGSFALLVRSVDEVPSADVVYALTVDADESYHVGNFLVHNCGSVNQAVAAGCLVMTTRRDALPTLYTDTAHWMDEGPDGCSMMSAEYPQWLASQIALGLHGEIPDQKAILARARGAADKFTWEKAALEMEAACAGKGWFTI